MPIYCYRCRSCGAEFELTMPIVDHAKPTKEPCPYCSGLTVQQVITVAPQVTRTDALSITKGMSGDWRNFLQRLDKKNPGAMKNVKLG